MKVNHTRLLSLVVLSAVICSCSKSKVGPANTGKELTLSVVEQQKVTTDNSFTLKLFKNLDSATTGGQNLFVSPLSVGFALGMTSNGAEGQTLDAIRNTMHFNGFTQGQINDYYNKLLTELPQLDPNTTVNIANSIWYKNSFTVVPQFLQTNSSAYDAKIQALDFASTTAPTSINNWVSQQTSGKITSIVKYIPSNAMMYLINAIYFKSTWKEKFDATKTAVQPFYTTANASVQASFMTGTIDFNYYNDNGTTICELPYSNDKYSMVIVMPAGVNDVHGLAASIDSAKWQGWMNKLSPAKDQVTLPKFKFAYGIDLIDALTQLGMGVAFSDAANFTGINAGGNLQINSVVHKAYIETDESGTTAAAVTSVGVGTSVAQPINANFNHPFIFAIREKSSGLILFAGTVNNPLLTGA